MRLLTSLLLAAALSTAAPAPEDEIRAAEKSWRQALVARDSRALDQLYTADLIYAHSTGKVESKKEYLDRLASGRQRYESWTEESWHITMHGDSAVCHSIARATGVNDNGAFNDHLMVMHLWVKQQGVWRLAAHQTTKIP
jgi:ketosteroid isomerase-like protein